MGKKFKNLRMIFMTMALVLFMAIGMEKEANAASASVDNLTQTGADKNSVTLAWTGENAASYKIYTRDANYNYILIGSTTATTYTVTGLESAKVYYFKVEPVALSTDDFTWDDYIDDAVTLPDQMKNVYQDSWYRFAKSCHVRWDDLSALEGYEYQVKNASGKTVAKGTETYGYCTFKINNNQVYTFKVRGYLTFGGQKYYTAWKEINCFEQAWVKSISQKTGSMTIKWTKVKGATGYDIYVSTKKNSGYKKVKSVGKNATSFTLKKFNKKKISKSKNYYVYVATKKKKDTSGVVYVWGSKQKGKSYAYYSE